MGTIDFSNDLLLPAPNYPNSFRVPLVSRGIVGVEFESLLELCLSPGKIPIVLHLVDAKNGMGASQGRVQLQGPAGGGIRFLVVFAGNAIITRQYAIGIGQTRIRQSVAGVFSDGLIEVGNCCLNVGVSSLVPRITAFQVEFIGFWI